MSRRFPPLLGPLLEQRLVARIFLAAGALQVGLTFFQLPGWPCPFRATTGRPCPGCGMSRALAALVRGDWSAALFLHAFAPLFAAAGVLLLLAAVLPAESRSRLAGQVAAVERATGAAVWLAGAFMVYWLVRLLYTPLTPPG
ncbi:MAG: DUF2752 domain-containing protein [Vicinamibacteria bacterium]